MNLDLLEAERTVESLYYLKSEKRSDYKTDEAFANFREVKVGGIKEKRLFRSSSPILCDERSFCAEKLCES